MMLATLAALLAVAAPLQVDKDRHSVTFTARSTDCGLDTQLEFLFVGPNSDHGYEAMFITDASVTDFAKAFAEAGIPTGAPVDFPGCRFWPVGEALTIEPAITNLVREMRGDKTPVIAYTGGTRDEKGIPEADTNMPSAVFALYNCPQSLLQFNDTLDQSTTYGRFQAAVKIPEGERRTFTLTWNGKPAHETLPLVIAPGKLQEAFTALKAKAEKSALSVTPDFSPELTVKDAQDAATAISMIDSVRVKINGFAKGQLFYRAYLPLEKWRDRKERLAQPPEVHFKADGTFVVTRIVEKWSTDDDVTDPTLVVTEHPCATLAEAAKLASEYSGKTLTVLAFAPATTKLAEIYRFRAAVSEEIVNWYVFTE